MKILHVVPSYYPAVRYGGPIYSVHGLCKALVELGHEVHVYTTNVDGPGSSDVPTNTIVEMNGVQVTYFSCGKLRRLYYSYDLAQALEANVSSFDFVHTHSVFLFPTWAAAKVARKSGVPYVVSPRGMLIKGLIQRRNSLIKNLWIALIEKRNIESAYAIHVTSEVEHAELRKFGWQLPQVVVVPNGVTIEDDGQASKISEDVESLLQQPFVLFLSRINWKKGVDRLIRVWSGAGDLRLIIAGNDEEGLLPKLRKQTHQANLSEAIKFIPRHVSKTDKSILYSSARVFVLPSYSENFGNVVIEAMAHGCPVVVSREVGAAEVVEASGAGTVVDGDSDELLDAIQNIIGDVQKREKMSMAGRDYVSKHYKWLGIASRILENCYKPIAIKAQNP